MKFVFWMTSVCIPLLVGTPLAGADDLNVLIKQQEEENASLRKEGIKPYFEVKSRTGYSAPRILSQWKVNRIPRSEPELQKLETLRRSFGLEVAKQLEKQAEFMLSHSPTDSLYDQSGFLLRFANWIGNKLGYGNWFLAERCHDVATVGLGRAIYDLNFPTDKLQPMLQSFSGAQWQTPAFRAELLNDEAGFKYFSIEQVSADMLSQAWSEYERGYIAWRRSVMTKAFDKGAGTEPASALAVGSPPEEFAFFADTWSTFSAPRTLVNLWDAKWHERIVVGGGSGNVSLANSLLVFRLKVGAFPNEPKKPPGRNEEPTKAAFRQAWEQFRQPNNASINSVYGGAFSAFVMLREGNFLDQDTAQIRMTTYAPK